MSRACGSNKNTQCALLNNKLEIQFIVVVITDRVSMDEQLKALQEQLKNTQKQQPVTTGNAELTQKIEQLEKALEEVQERNETLEKETEEMYVLLADNNQKILKYKTLLMKNSIPLSDSESEGSSEEEDDEGEVD